MKYLHILINLMLPLCITAQAQILGEDFNTAIPTNWAQSPVSTWSFHPTFGTSGSGCAISEDMSMNTPTVSLRTPIMNLGGVSNLTITFKAAVIKNNFISPNVAVSYNAGAGTQFVARWGSGFSSNTTYTITESAEFGYPLNAANVHWVACSHTLSSINGSNAIFYFDAEFVNGGFVLIDDIMISGKKTVTTGVNASDPPEAFVLFPNPSAGAKITLRGKVFRQLMLSDQLGRAIPLAYTTTGETTAEISLDTLKPGIYFLEILTDANTLIRKKMILEP